MKKKKKTQIIGCLKNTLLNIEVQSPSDMYKKLRMTEGERNEDQVYVIKKVLDKMKKKTLKMYLKAKHLRLKTTKK